MASAVESSTSYGSFWTVKEWLRWASLSAHLPLLAEAGPGGVP